MNQGKTHLRSPVDRRTTSNVLILATNPVAYQPKLQNMQRCDLDMPASLSEVLASNEIRAVVATHEDLVEKVARFDPKLYAYAATEAGRRIENCYLQRADDIRKKIGKIFANTLSIFVGRGKIRAC